MARAFRRIHVASVKCLRKAFVCPDRGVAPDEGALHSYHDMTQTRYHGNQAAGAMEKDNDNTLS